MNCMNEMRLQIDPDALCIHVENQDRGIISCKNIALDTFFECVRQSLDHEGIKSGFLPEHCFHFSMNSRGDRDYCLWYPHLHADIQYYGTEYPDFPLPRLVFGLSLSKEGKVTSCRLGVTDDEAPRESTRMYAYPFSNVAEFHLCTGNNPLPVYKRPQTLTTLPSFLLRLPNNNDRFLVTNNKLRMQYRELLEHLKRKDPCYYYTDVLVSNERTLKDFVNSR